jgi:hypothetical protein
VQQSKARARSMVPKLLGRHETLHPHFYLP